MICFAGDFLRTQRGDADQLGNVIWTSRLFSPVLSAVTGKPTEIRFPSPVDAWRVIGTAPGVEAWSEIFWQDPPDALIDFVKGTFKNADLVVAIELPPILEKTFDRLRIPWVEVGVSPLRFLPDFAVLFRFSSELGTPSDYHINSEEIESALSAIKAYYRPAAITGTVFFGQTPHDRTQIGRDGFVKAEDQLDKLNGPIFIKPHPFAPDAPVVQAALKRGAKIIGENTYALLRSEGVSVATLSSSVGIEAKAFGRPTTIFHPDVLNRNLSGITVLNGYRSSDFWRTVLRGWELTDAVLADELKPHRLRSDLDFYGLDPDVYPT